jgi:hypothetical protein
MATPANGVNISAKRGLRQWQHQLFTAEIAEHAEWNK